METDREDWEREEKREQHNNITLVAPFSSSRFFVSLRLLSLLFLSLSPPSFSSFSSLSLYFLHPFSFLGQLIIIFQVFSQSLASHLLRRKERLHDGITGFFLPFFLSLSLSLSVDDSLSLSLFRWFSLVRSSKQHKL